MGRHVMVAPRNRSASAMSNDRKRQFQRCREQIPHIDNTGLAGCGDLEVDVDRSPQQILVGCNNQIMLVVSILKLTLSAESSGLCSPGKFPIHL